MPWLQACIAVDKNRLEQAERLFETFGALSITLLDAQDHPMLEPPPGTTPVWAYTRVNALFDGSKDTPEMRAALQRQLHAAGLGPVHFERFADQAWERAWLEHFQPMRFGQRLWICPHGHTIEERDATIVHLDPGLAFGTGTHPTTHLCLEWLEQAPLTGCRLIDFGCGSGILAIAALKLGASQAVAIDHDPQALLATRDNARSNQVDAALTIIDSQQPVAQPADIIIANILANVLEALSAHLTSLLKPGGRLILSGILEEQAAKVRSAYADAIVFTSEHQRDGWVLLEGKKIS